MMRPTRGETIMTNHFKTLTAICALTALGACGDTSSQSDRTHTAASLDAEASIERPKYNVTTTESFDASVFGAYEGDHSAVYAHIDANIDDHVGHLQRWLRQRSISAQNDGIQEMAELVRSDFEALGFQETAIVPTDGHPGVWGYLDQGADKTLMVYMMYDVQPVNPEDWDSPPFEANIVDHELGKVIMARGAVNQKGPQRAFLNAVQSIMAVEGKLPVNLMITAEGEEELGSPNYPQIVDQYEDRLKTADGVIFPFPSQGPTGGANMILGVKGILYYELEAQGGEWGGPAKAEIHGSFKAIVDSPVWRLTQALASLTTPDGNTVLVDGFYDGVRPPTAEEQRLINGVAANWDDAGMQGQFAVSRWIDGLTGKDAILEMLYTPSLNIDGIVGGYTEEGVKTILPHKALAKVDSRLPYGLDPDAVLAKVRAHLDAHGFSDIKVTKLSGYPAAQTSVESDLVSAVIRVFNKYGHTPSVQPRIAGSAPFYQFTERLNLPMVPTGLGYGTGAHAPNEILLIEPKDDTGAASLAEMEKAYVDMLYALAAAGRAGK